MQNKFYFILFVVMLGNSVAIANCRNADIKKQTGEILFRQAMVCQSETPMSLMSKSCLEKSCKVLKNLTQLKYEIPKFNQELVSDHGQPGVRLCKMLGLRSIYIQTEGFFPPTVTTGIYICSSSVDQSFIDVGSLLFSTGFGEKKTKMNRRN